jgi:uncharacterized protein with LGFP repeats
MSAVVLDSGRLDQLRVFSASEVRQIASDVIDAVEAQLERLAAELSAGTLQGAAEAAHRARNETLLIGALELCAEFSSLEDAARAGDRAAGQQAAQRAAGLWPPTRAAIAVLGAPDAQAPLDGSDDGANRSIS